MPLSNQELRCIKLASAHLALVHGGEWQVILELDNENPSIPSPDAKVGNGRKTAAIEVKRLGVAEINQYNEWKPSLEHRLAPDCVGSFLLIPCDQFSLPVDKLPMRLLQREVGITAPPLQPGEVGAVRILRRGYLVRLNGASPGRLMCTRHDGSEALHMLGPQLDGWYYLIHDDSPWGHQFVTEAGRILASDAFVAASAEPNADHPFGWIEEWELRRFDDGSSDERHFEILAVSEVFTEGSAVAAMRRVLETGQAKFHRRWADEHVLVLEARAPIIHAERLSALTEELGVQALDGVDMVLLIDDENLTQVWPRPA